MRVKISDSAEYWDTASRLFPLVFSLQGFRAVAGAYGYRCAEGEK